MSVCAFNHSYLGGLLGDEETARYFTAEAEISAMLAFERALATAQASVGLIPAEAARRIADVCGGFRPDVAALRTATARDGVVVPELVKQLRNAAGEEAGRHVHFGATSQDVIDTGLMLRLRQVSVIFLSRLAELDLSFIRLDSEFGDHQLMAHSRMQAAISITAGDRIESWRRPMARHQDRLKRCLEHCFPVQFGGAAGTLEKLGDKGAVVRGAIAQELGLIDEPQWHSQRDKIAEFASLLSLVTGSLGKFGQDIALLAQGGTEIKLSGGGGSSAMPHKQNPVKAEALVALARYNATQVAGLHHSLVHEQERSGSAWTLEWLMLPPITVATGASLRLALGLSHDIRTLGAT